MRLFSSAALRRVEDRVEVPAPRCSDAVVDPRFKSIWVHSSASALGQTITNHVGNNKFRHLSPDSITLAQASKEQ